MTSKNESEKAVLWTKDASCPVCDRHQLFIGGIRTPYFVDHAKHISHRTSGSACGVFGAGMHPKGIALELASFDRISEAKGFAVKCARRREARARHAQRRAE